MDEPAQEFARRPLPQELIHCAILVGHAVAGPWAALSAREISLLPPSAVSKRRDEFARGRWTAKRVLSRAFEGTSPGDFQVLVSDRGAPLACRVDGTPIEVSLSISHTRELAVAAACSAAARVGVDVQLVERRVLGIMRTQGSESDRIELDQLVEREAEDRATMLWTVKEAAGKALGWPLMTALRSIQVGAAGEPVRGWRRLQVRDLAGGEQLRMWTRREEQAWVSVCVAVGGEVMLDRFEPDCAEIFRGTAGRDL